MPPSDNLILPQAGLKLEPLFKSQRTNTSHKQRAVCVGITSPMGGLGVAESKVQVWEQMAFRKLREEVHPFPPGTPCPSPWRRGKSLHQRHLPGAGPHSLFIFLALMEGGVGETQGLSYNAWTAGMDRRQASSARL